MVLILPIILTLPLKYTIFGEDKKLVGHRITDSYYRSFVEDFEKLTDNEKKAFLLDDHSMNSKVVDLRDIFLSLMNNKYKGNEDMSIINIYYKSYSEFDKFKVAIDEKLNEIALYLKYNLLRITNCGYNKTDYLKSLFKNILSQRLSSGSALSLIQLDGIYRRCNNYLNEKKSIDSDCESISVLYLIINFVKNSIYTKKISRGDLSLINRFENIISIYFYEILHYNIGEDDKLCHFNMERVSQIINSKILKLLISLRKEDFIQKMDSDELLELNNFKITDLFTLIFKENRNFINKSALKIFTIFFGDLYNEMMKYRISTRDNNRLYKKISEYFLYENEDLFEKKIIELHNEYKIGDELIEQVRTNNGSHRRFLLFERIINSNRGYINRTEENIEESVLSDEQLDREIISELLERECDVENLEPVLNKRVDNFIRDFIQDIDEDNFFEDISAILFHSYITSEIYKEICQQRITIDEPVGELLDLIHKTGLQFK